MRLKHFLLHFILLYFFFGGLDNGRILICHLMTFMISLFPFWCVFEREFFASFITRHFLADGAESFCGQFAGDLGGLGRVIIQLTSIQKS